MIELNTRASSEPGPNCCHLTELDAKFMQGLRLAALHFYPSVAFRADLSRHFIYNAFITAFSPATISD